MPKGAAALRAPVQATVGRLALCADCRQLLRCALGEATVDAAGVSRCLECAERSQRQGTPRRP